MSLLFNVDYHKSLTPIVKHILPEKIVTGILGRFPPPYTIATRQALTLVGHIQDDGTATSVWGLGEDKLAPRRIVTRTEAQAAHSLQELRYNTDNWQKTILFLDAALHVRAGWRGQAERARRLLILHSALKRKTDVHMILISQPLRRPLASLLMTVFILRLLLHRTQIKFHRAGLPAARLFQRIFGRSPQTAPLPGIERIAGVPPDRARRASVELLTLQLAHANAEMSADIAEECRAILEAVLDPAVRTPGWLRMPDGICSGPVELDTAKGFSHLHPAPNNLMIHLSRLRRPGHPLPRNDSEARRLLDWYLSRSLMQSTPSFRPPLSSAALAGLNDPKSQLPSSLRLPSTPLPARKRLARAIISLIDRPQQIPDPALSVTVGGAQGLLTRGELALALLAGAPLAARETLWSSPSIREWFAIHIADLYPHLKRLSSRPPQQTAKTINVVGYGDNETGLARNRNMSIQAISKLGLAVRDVGLTQPAQAATSGLHPKRAFTLFHLNGDQLPQIMAERPCDQAKGLNAAFALWELGQIPAEHRLALAMMDELWAPSHFVADSYRAITEKPVIWMGKGLTLPDKISAPLSYTNQPKDCFTFLICFDFHSSVERKNPVAAVRAFMDAFPKHRNDVRLLVKTTPIRETHWGDPNGQMNAIRKMAAGDPRIKVIEQMLPFAEFLGLIAAADCLISSHRAEGFGYVPAYAMLLGTPVIATDFGGTQDFCTPNTSYPINFHRVSVPKGHCIHDTEGAFWADINHDHLCSTLDHVVENPQQTQQRIIAGEALMQQTYSMEALSHRYMNRLRLLGII